MLNEEQKEALNDMRMIGKGTAPQDTAKRDVCQECRAHAIWVAEAQADAEGARMLVEQVCRERDSLQSLLTESERRRDSAEKALKEVSERADEIVEDDAASAFDGDQYYVGRRDAARDIGKIAKEALAPTGAGEEGE